jgi:hypothetical protein
MLESHDTGDMFHAPFGRAQASWIGGPDSLLIGLEVTVPGARDSITGLPIRWMVRMDPKEANVLFESLIDSFGRTEEGKAAIQKLVAEMARIKNN